MLKEIVTNVRNTTPLVHCITNYVTVNDVANILLACGASPIMADDENEVEEITSICTSLTINIGTLNERTISSMLKAGKKANELNHPWCLIRWCRCIEVSNGYHLFVTRRSEVFRNSR